MWSGTTNLSDRLDLLDANGRWIVPTGSGPGDMKIMHSCTRKEHRLGAGFGSERLLRPRKPRSVLGTSVRSGPRQSKFWCVAFKHHLTHDPSDRSTSGKNERVSEICLRLKATSARSRRITADAEVSDTHALSFSRAAYDTKGLRAPAQQPSLSRKIRQQRPARGLAVCSGGGDFSVELW